MAKKKTRQSKGFLHRDMTVPEKWIALILFLSLCITTYFVMPISRISTISVVGTNELDKAQVIARSKIVPNQTILSAWLKTNEVKEMIKQDFFRVDTVDISISANNTYIIAIKEYDTIAIVEIDGNYYSVLANGTILQDDSQKYMGTVPIIKWDGSMDTLEIAMKEFAKVEPSLRHQVSEIIYHETDKLVMSLYMSDGNQIKVNYTEFAKKLNYYNTMKTIIKDKQGIIDLTVGAYFSPYE
ncbi:MULTISPECIES: cell division protein FtsQ/DivIB [unclassified Granulicatella]|uniref:cell division protein FtsQ/DivIB n=1 Tax=unclassified Granulicatella TaxID=2630493 RepID=UPI0010739F98|nr:MULTISPECIES: cell division protein FtsQ/DivIB [unclassified Granulicatella]MBF0780160.1 cell division protein FtsQ/DivIB [Granulicatella sp. 19428wC4_WM01]TFU95764.1 FtsQ-type POTRA domain-containing protein [Granulicatella sp. WM01]